MILADLSDALVLGGLGGLKGGWLCIQHIGNRMACVQLTRRGTNAIKPRADTRTLRTFTGRFLLDRVTAIREGLCESEGELRAGLAPKGTWYSFMWLHPIAWHPRIALCVDGR